MSRRRKSIRWTAKSIPANQPWPMRNFCGNTFRRNRGCPVSPLLAPEALRSGRLTGFAVAEHLAPKPESRRITLTLEMINAARCCLYLATGEGKRPPLGKALDLLAPASLPVQLVRPKGGELIWVMDEAACGGRQ